MKTKTVERAILAGRKAAGLPHRSALRVLMSREAFDAYVAPLERLPLLRGVRYRLGCAEVTVTLNDREGLRWSARVLHRVLALVRRRGEVPRFVGRRRCAPDSCGCAWCAELRRR